MMDKTEFLNLKRDTGGDFSITNKFFIGIKTNPVIFKNNFRGRRSEVVRRVDIK